MVSMEKGEREVEIKYILQYLKKYLRYDEKES